MLNPRSKTGLGVRFPYRFEKNGRTGRIKRWSEGKFGTYSLFGAKKVRNSFRSFEAAWEYLEREFSRLDTDRANSLSLNPINHDVKTYSELEQILRERGGGASLHDGSSWAVKTRVSVRGTFVSLFIYSRDMLKALRNQERTEAQLVKNPQRNAKEEAGIYTPDQMRMLLLTVLETDVTLMLRESLGLSSPSLP